MMQIRSFLTILICLYIGIHLSDVYGQQYYIDQFSLQQGINSVSINCLEEDRTGYLWIGTKDRGLSRFDGTSFETFDAFDGQVNVIIEDSISGFVYFGTGQGLFYYDGFRMQSLPFRDPVQSIALYKDSIFFTSVNKLWFLKNDTITAYCLEKDLPHDVLIQTIYTFNNGLLLGTNQGLFSIHEGLFKSIPFTITNEDLFMDVRAISHIDDQLYVGTSNGVKKLLFSNGKYLEVGTSTDVLNISSIVPFHKTAILLASVQEGLFVLDSDDLDIAYAIDRMDGLMDNQINCLLSSRKGVFWIGSDNSGLFKYATRSYSIFNVEQGLSGNNVLSALSHKDKILVASDQGKVDVIQHDIVLDKSIKNPLAEALITTMEFDEQDRLWFGTNGQGLVMKDSSGFLHLDTNGGLAGNFIKKLLSDKKNIVWVATMSQGISRINTGTQGGGVFEIQNFSKSNGLRHTRINDICLKGDNELWIATSDGGLYQIKNDTVFHNNKSYAYFQNDPVKAIQTGYDGEIYFLTSRRFGKWQNNKAEILYEQKANPFISMVEFDQGKWIIGAKYSIIEVSVDEDGPSIQNLNPNRAFEGIELNPNGLIMDENQRVLFATRQGLLIYRPERKDNNTSSAFDIHLADLTVDYHSFIESDYAEEVDKWFQLQDELEFHPGIEQLGFYFKAVNHARKNRYLYRWKLEGLDKKWSPWKESNEIQFSNLNAGKYRFRVQAKSGDLLVEKQTGYFLIKQYYWKKPWFITSSIVSLIGLIIIIAIWRIRFIRKKHHRYITKIELEHQLIQLEQKTRQLQMNPHFLNNALHSIQSLIVMENTTEARKYLNEFAVLMRMVLNHSRSSTVPLEDEIELLKKYLTIERFINNESFEFTLDCAKSIEPSIRIPAMMLQPYVENAVKHGIRYAEQKGQIQIRFSPISAVKIKCTISDNGQGIEYSKNKQKSRKSNSISMEVLSQRMEILHGRKGNWIQINEIKNDSGRIDGVEVSLILPVS